MRTAEIILLLSAAAAITKGRGIGRVYEQIPAEFYECNDGTYSDHARKGACVYHKGLKSTTPVQLTKGAASSLGVIDMPLDKIFVNHKLFQNRETAFSARSVQNIIDDARTGNFNWPQFDAIIIWMHPDDKKYYILSGHSRTEAFRQLCAAGVVSGGKDFCKIPAKIFHGTMDEAIEVALKSNTLATQETMTERAAFYRSQRAKGVSNKDLMAMVKKNEGANSSMIWAVSFLHPNGKVMTALKLMETGDQTSVNNLKNLALWIGKAMERFTMLNVMHENEMYDYLVQGGYGQYTNYNDFLRKIETVIHQRTTFGTFNANELLNLRNLGQKGNVEKNYDELEHEKKMRVRELEKQYKFTLEDLKKRGATPADLDRIMAPIEQTLRRARLDLQDWVSRKGQILAQQKQELNLFAMAGIGRPMPRRNFAPGYLCL